MIKNIIEQMNFIKILDKFNVKNLLKIINIKYLTKLNNITIFNSYFGLITTSFSIIYLSWYNGIKNYTIYSYVTFFNLISIYKTI